MSAPLTHVALMHDGYGDRPRGQRGELEAQIAALRARLWSEPGERDEIEDQLRALQAVLARLDQTNGDGR